MIARQAIVNAQQAVIGYELFNRSRTGIGHTAATDVILVFTALSHAGTEELVGKKLIFVNCTHESLSGGHLELLDPDKVVLEIPPLGHAAAQEVETRLPILMGLRERGFHLAFNHTVLESAYAAWLPLADYIKLDLSVLAPDQLAGADPLRRTQQPGRVDCREGRDSPAIRHGFQPRGATVPGLLVRAPRRWWRPSCSHPHRPASSTSSTWCASQASTDDIEEVLKKDAGLAFNLMRLINSAGFGLNREITSFRQAVMLLGLKKLFRWAALLLTAARTGAAPSSVGQTAVVRGRLMELLALESMPPEEADQAFVVGIFSLLDVMLSIPMESALKLLTVPDAVAAALLRREGVLGDLLTLAEACESSDDAVFHKAAGTLHLSSQQINMAHLQALAWADQMTE